MVCHLWLVLSISGSVLLVTSMFPWFGVLLYSYPLRPSELPVRKATVSSHVQDTGSSKCLLFLFTVSFFRSHENYQHPSLSVLGLWWTKCCTHLFLLKTTPFCENGEGHSCSIPSSAPSRQKVVSDSGRENASTSALIRIHTSQRDNCNLLTRHELEDCIASHQPAGGSTCSLTAGSPCLREESHWASVAWHWWKLSASLPLHSG